MTQKELNQKLKERNFIIEELINEGHDTCIHEISEKGNIKIEDVIFEINWAAVDLLQIIGQINERIKEGSETEQKLKIVKEIKAIIHEE